MVMDLAGDMDETKKNRERRERKLDLEVLLLIQFFFGG
jgi:hypothetical protein